MLASTANIMLRAGAGRSAGALQPTLLRTAACPYSAGLSISPASMASNPAKQTQNRLITTKTTTATTTRPTASSLLTKRGIAQQQPPCHPASINHQQQRSASTADAEADARAASAVAKAAATAAANSEQVVLDWNTFFQLRKARRRWQSAFSVLGSVATGSGGAVALSSGVADSVLGHIPLDPLFTLGLMTMSCAALGWLVGPFLGTAVFNMLKSKYKRPMAAKESEFFARIKKNRVDPSASSVRNPVPDFYGEKISSVADYRQWLKDQRAFNRKKTGAI